MTKFSYLGSTGNGTPRRNSGSQIHSMSRSEIPISSQVSDVISEKDESVKDEVANVDPIVEVEDPEAANRGHAKRPMLLTHSIMVGLTCILIIAVEALVISKVN
jgi:hypothetical protein